MLIGKNYIFIFMLAFAACTSFQSTQKKSTPYNHFHKELISWAEKIYRQNPREITLKGKKFSIDCSNYVRAVYYVVTGKDLFHEATKTGIYQKLARQKKAFGEQLGVLMLYVLFEHRYHVSKTPAVGDIIFFDNTYDKNKNQRKDDILTHTGLVVAVDEDGTATFLHAGTSKGIRKSVLNLHYPHAYKKGDKILNSYLRHKYTWDQSDQRLAGELVRGFGRF